MSRRRAKHLGIQNSKFKIFVRVEGEPYVTTLSIKKDQLTIQKDKPVSRLRQLALIEGISFLVILFITMPLKYLMDMPQPNKVFGMVHGLLFVIYIVYLAYMWASRKWSFSVLAWGFAASIVPFLIFWVEKKVFGKL